MRPPANVILCAAPGSKTAPPDAGEQRHTLAGDHHGNRSVHVRYADRAFCASGCGIRAHVD